jgi:hypothetical protein
VNGLILGIVLLGSTPEPVLSAPPPTQCIEANAQLDVTLNTAINSAGDAFTFTMVADTPKAGAIPAIPAGTRGYGVVAYAAHAGGGGAAGTIVIEPRYIALKDGRQVQVIADPLGRDRILNGKSKNAPSLVEQLPVIGWAAGGYNAMHHGKDVVLAKGTVFTVLIGDALATAACYVYLHETR